ncbi:MAG: hypothetical protein R3C15_16365 [Thermoleophilia bacterium]
MHAHARADRRRGPAATTEIVHLELLAAAGTRERGEELRRLLARFELLPIEGLADHEAAVALRTGPSVLHRDRDDAALADVAPLTVESS